MRTRTKSMNTLMDVDRGGGTRARLRTKIAVIVVSLLALIALQLPGEVYAQGPWPQVGGTTTIIHDGAVIVRRIMTGRASPEYPERLLDAVWPALAPS